MKKNATFVFFEPLSFMEIAHYAAHQTYNVSLTVTSVLGCVRILHLPLQTTTAEFSVQMVLYQWHTLGTNLTEH